ncbi:MAG TPA: shikimate dehydrogenase [Pyrinomonadaceae bacterium]|nr:shikimate dehydrogenase [Pyrinomonadaceae bacterium]
MNNGRICVSVCGETADEVLAQIERGQAVADVVEVRFDCVSGTEFPSLLNRLAHINTPLLLTFRPMKQGGHRTLTFDERLKFWENVLWKLENNDVLVDHEFDLDLPLDPDPDRTIISFHDFQTNGGSNLTERFDELANLTGKAIKIAVNADRITDSIGVWKLLQHAESTGKDLIPIAMGEPGKWTRILGLAYGAPLVYASLDSGRETGPGQISAADLRDVFRVKDLDSSTEVFGIIAADTSYTFSPYLHNAAFKAAEMNKVFTPLQVDDLDAFMRRMVDSRTREIEINFAGFSVTNPHKQAIVKYLSQVDPTAEAIGAVNTVRIEHGRFIGFNTDATGFIKPLRDSLGDLAGARVAVVGAGGAARACAYALKQERADVTILARDTTKATALGRELNVAVDQLTTDHRPLTTDVLVNATPLGTKGDRENETIATAEELHGVRLVYDLVYNPTETRLLREAKTAGVATINGLEMFLAQGAKQFEIWTDHEAPVDAMREAVVRRLR